ncbi:MAG: SlyX family protein [Magnetospirillum sp.]|nr:SlyX family protein [Magnetospirillum sp.]
MTEALERRVIELESRLAHHERMAEELSAVLAGQTDAIGSLTAQVRRLAERLRDVEAGWERSPQDDKPPPHY